MIGTGKRSTQTFARLGPKVRGTELRPQVRQISGVGVQCGNMIQPDAAARVALFTGVGRLVFLRRETRRAASGTSFPAHTLRITVSECFATSSLRSGAARPTRRVGSPGPPCDLSRQISAPHRRSGCRDRTAPLPLSLNIPVLGPAPPYPTPSSTRPSRHAVITTRTRLSRHRKGGVAPHDLYPRHTKD